MAFPSSSDRKMRSLRRLCCRLPFYRRDMKECGLYIIKQSYFDLIRRLGGDCDDASCTKRPVYCCVKDAIVEGLYWAIPTSDYSHRSQEQIDKINDYLSKSDSDLRSCYYHIARTTKRAIYKISSCFPITDAYIDHEFTSYGQHVVLRNKTVTSELERKLHRILSFEAHKNNYFPQKITAIKSFLINELQEK